MTAAITQTLPPHQLRLTLERAEAVGERAASLLDRLAEILDRFRNQEDELALQLFDWGARSLERVQPAAKHLAALDRLLRVTQIQLMGEPASLLQRPIDPFSREMALWLRDAQRLMQIPPPISPIDFTKIPLAAARNRIYTDLLSIAQKTQRVMRNHRQIEGNIARATRERRQLAEDLKKAVERAKESIRAREEHMLQRISEIESRHRTEMDDLICRLDVTNRELTEARATLRQAEEHSSEQTEKVSRLAERLRSLQGRVRELQNELDEPGSCTIL